MASPPRAHGPSRRRLLRGGLGLIGAGALAGCGGRSSDGLQVWGGVPPENGPARVIEAFRREHAGADVTYTPFVNDERGNLKLDTALQGGVDVDVYFTYQLGDLALRAQSGMLADLTDLVLGDPELAPYLDRGTPSALWDGDRITALTTAKDPNFVLCNEELLDRSGVTLPGEWTAEEFEEAARRLTTTGTYGAYGVPDLARIALGPNYWYTRSGDANFGDPAFLRWMSTGRRMIDDGVAYPWTEVLARKLEIYQQDVFLTQDFALWPTAPFSLRFLNDGERFPHTFRTAAAPLPTVSAGENWNTGLFGNFVMVNPRSKRPELAREFVRFWVTAGAPLMLRAGKIPTLDSRVSEDDVLTGLLGEEAERWFDTESFRRVLFEDRLSTDTNLTAVPEISLMVTQQRDLCWIGEKSPEGALGTLNSQAQAAIQRNRGGN